MTKEEGLTLVELHFQGVLGLMLSRHDRVELAEKAHEAFERIAGEERARLAERNTRLPMARVDLVDRRNPKDER